MNYLLGFVTSAALNIRKFGDQLIKICSAGLTIYKPQKFNISRTLSVICFNTEISNTFFQIENVLKKRLSPPLGD